MLPAATAINSSGQSAAGKHKHGNGDDVDDDLGDDLQFIARLPQACRKPREHTE